MPLSVLLISFCNLLENPNGEMTLLRLPILVNAQPTEQGAAGTLVDLEIHEA